VEAAKSIVGICQRFFENFPTTQRGRKAFYVLFVANCHRLMVPAAFPFP